MIRIVAYGFLLLILVGCRSAESSPIQIPTQDSQNADVSIQTVSLQIPPDIQQEATQVPLAQQNIDPGILIQLGNRYRTNGYLGEAVNAYQAVLSQPDANPVWRAEAAYELGRAALQEGLFAQAVDAMTLLITQFPQDTRVPQALFLRGDAYLGLSMWENAIADFQQYLAIRGGLIDSYAYERIGDAQLALGQTEAALNSYSISVESNRTLVPQLVLREKLGEIYESMGRIDDALAQYDAILAVAQNAPYRSQIELRAGQVLLNGGRTDLGMARMRNIVNSYPNTASAYTAAQTLLDGEFEVDNFVLGKIAYSYGDYQQAIEAFNTYSTERILSSIPAEMYLLLGRAYREVGNSAAARVAFQTLIDQYPQSPLFGDALLEQGRTFFLEGDIPQAISTYTSIADNYGYLNEAAADALWRVGYLYGTNDSPVLSREAFVRLAENYPNYEFTANGLFIAASSAIQSEQWSVAENLYGRLATISSGDDQAAAYLWVGKLALQRGEVNTANEVFQLAVNASPDSYFAARASDILIGREAFQRPNNYQFEFDDATQLAEAEAWLRQVYGITQEGDLWRLSPELENDPRLIRGRELWTVGAYAEADEEFGDLNDEAWETRDYLMAYQLAIFLRGIGSYQQSIISASYVIIGSGYATTAAPPYIARLRYPAYYLIPIIEVANTYGVDPLLMFSLIRHESLFNTNATAGAGEKGLTQVIPSTGQYIANQLNWENYNHSDLFRPHAGITFGAYYLSEQLGLFDGNVPTALSAYNAGPGRAQDWYILSGGDPDLLMTAITISSTRTYVQRIYGYYNVYRELYGT